MNLPGLRPFVALLIAVAVLMSGSGSVATTLTAHGRATPGTRVLARPDGDSDSEDAFTAPLSARHTYDTTHFRLHWTSTTEDATATTFVKDAAMVFEEVWDVEIDRLGWPRPPSDGSLGGNDLVDVYFVDLGEGAYGYATADDASLCRDCTSAHGYLVLDNDYLGFFPDVSGALRSTAAHEFGHLVQFGMVYNGEGWAFEATAVWLERVVFPTVDARTQYLQDFSAHPELALTDFGSSTGGFDRAYGAYVWNVWLADRYGPAIVRDAWQAASQADGHVLQGYATALAGRGVLLDQELVAFTAATAGWDHGGFPGEPGTYPPLSRQPDLAVGAVQSVQIDHSAAYVADVVADGAVTVTVRGPKFIAGGVALVAASGSEVLVVVDDTLFDGEATVTLPQGADIGRVTVVVVNADPALAVPKPPSSDRPRYLFDDVEYLIGVDVVPGPLVKR
ncbi:MAG: MXAN_6640 family putative metalloprotease [Euzebya sp.]